MEQQRTGPERQQPPIGEQQPKPAPSMPAAGAGATYFPGAIHHSASSAGTPSPAVSQNTEALER